MRYDATHKTQTRERILQAASAALRTRGPEGTGVAAVMQDVGLTHGGFYAHFRNKDDLIAETVTHMFDDRYAQFESQTPADPAPALAGFIDFYLSMGHRNAPARGCPIPALSSQLPRLDEKARCNFDRGVLRLEQHLDAIIAALPAGQAQDASSVLSEMVGALILARTTDDPIRAEALLARSRKSLKARLGLPDLRVE